MMKINRLLCLIGLVVFSIPLSFAKNTSIDPLLRFIETLADYDSFSLNFSQEIMSSVSGQDIKEGGIVYIQRPESFRWEYFASKNIVVSDGKHVLMLIPDEKQAMMEPVHPDSILMSPLSLLTHPEYVKKNYKIEPVVPTSGYQYAFRLIPRKDTGFLNAVIEFNDMKDIRKFRLIITDLSNNINRLTFENFQLTGKNTITLPVIPDDYVVTDFSGSLIQSTPSNGEK